MNGLYHRSHKFWPFVYVPYDTFTVKLPDSSKVFVQILCGRLPLISISLLPFFSMLNRLKIMLHILIYTMHVIVCVKISNNTHHDYKVLTQSVHILTCFSGVLAYKVNFLMMMVATTKTCYNMD